VGEGVLKPRFARVGGELWVEGVRLQAIAEACGTPLYVYSLGTIRDRYRELKVALASVPHRLQYSLKANSSRALLCELRALGAGADVVSGGELYRALQAGFPPQQVVFGGVGKTAAELEEGLEARILLFNVESEGELALLDGIGSLKGVRAPVGIRVNPQLRVPTPHEYTRTGEPGQKFGFALEAVGRALHLARSLSHIELLALHMHVGSQVDSLETFAEGVERLLEVCDMARAAGTESLRYLDIGGGLAVPYEGEDRVDLVGYADIVAGAARRSGLEIIVEPGRFLVAEAGVLLTRVLYRKSSAGRTILVTDAGMTELLRPSHYRAYHHVEPVLARDGALIGDVVGPVCESGDFLALGRSLPEIYPGDILAVFTAGAYGYTMASNYNSRLRPSEVVVDGDRYAIATRRERYEDLVRLESPELDWRVVG
jgi:diaminopimelate decarboxylase